MASQEETFHIANNEAKSIAERSQRFPTEHSSYISPGDVAKESYRLSTFKKYPQMSPVNPNPTHLASAGFYYTGYKNMVTCFCCGNNVENWCVGDDVKSPQWHTIKCEFINGQDCGNQPIGGWSVNSGSLREVFRDMEPTLLNSETTDPDANVASSHQEQRIKCLNLFEEIDRLKTFETVSAKKENISASDLAHSGLYHLGSIDRYQCFSCNIVLISSINGNSIKAEHRRLSPRCRMIQGTETRNVALAAPPLQTHRESEIQEPPDPSESTKRVLKTVFPCLCPVNPHMRYEKKRLATFDSRWPASGFRASPSQLAKAGYFFLGERDRVKCWYCNGGLQNWEPGHEPWTEHAKWFPRCEFLLQQKSFEFVSQIVSQYPDVVRPTHWGQPVTQRPPRSLKGVPSPISANIPHMAEVAKQEQFIQFMAGDLVKFAKDKGFETTAIQLAVARRLWSGKHLYTSATDLVNDIIQTENINQSSDDKMSSQKESKDSNSPTNDLKLYKLAQNHS
ncbi:baculoviral IAP repeat-containing protein 7-like [Ciona intestinalis]